MESNQDHLKKAQTALKAEIATGDYYVLFLDDQVELLALFAGVASSYGLKPLTASTSSEALALIEKHSNQLVLVISDFMMPEVDGFAFRQMVKDRRPNLPFAILSGYVDREMALRALELKIACFLDKPLDLNKFSDFLMNEALPRIKSMKEDEELLQGFIGETEDLIEQGQDLLMKMDEDQNDANLLNSFFGIVHTMKGASSFFENQNMHRFAHRFEDVLKKLQRGELRVSSEMVSGLLLGLDFIREMVLDFKTGNFRTYDIDDLLRQILEPSEDSATAPAAEDSADKATKTSSNSKNSPAKQSEIKVAVAELDEFMQLSGEMTVIRNMLNKSIRAIEKQYAGDKDIAILVELLDELHKINALVQSKVTELRKVPMRNILKPMSRAVRDVAKNLKKDIGLTVVGEELKVDTSIAEVLSNSLLHLVKNSMDHGLEKPEERVQAGKEAQGKISIISSVENESVVVRIEDDGKGINAQAIRAKAVQNGLLSQIQANELSEDELFPLVFESGFSTAKEVTDISGRGVGMSMVKDSVESIGGSIRIQSTTGKGASFTLRFPIPKSVLITNCLFVRGGADVFGLVEEDIVRVVMLDEEQKRETVRSLEGVETYLLDGELLPLVSLKTILGLPSATKASELNLVIINSSVYNRKIALQVDQVLDMEDTVIKRLIPQVNFHNLYQGATFLNDGTIGLILSTGGLFENAHVSKRGVVKAMVEANAIEAVKTERLILVEIAQAGLYGLAQESIYRIEEMKRNKIVFSATGAMIPYRNHALRLFDLNSLLFGSHTGQWKPGGMVAEDDEVSVIVIEKNSNLFGLVVNRVVDLVEAQEFLAGEGSPEESIRGHVVVAEKTVALIDLESAFQKVNQAGEVA